MNGIPRAWADAGRWAGLCFEPTTIAIVAATAAVAGAGLSAVGSIRQGQAAEAAGKFNAQVAENNARAAQQAGAEEANRLNVENRRRLASARAAAGSSGVDPSSGSPLDVLADNAAQLRLMEETARWQAAQHSAGFANDATIARFGGRQAASAGYINAGGTLLSAVGKVGMSYPGSASSPASVKPDAVKDGADYSAGKFTFPKG